MQIMVDKLLTRVYSSMYKLTAQGNVMQEQLEAIDTAIDALDQMIMDLPLQDSVKRALTAHLYEMWTELEEFTELRSADFD